MPKPERAPLTGIKRRLARAPIWLYEHRMGWVMTGHFILLNHVGRRSGLPRQAVVEVCRHDGRTGSYVICSGWGERSQWFQNLMANPNITIQVRDQRIPVTSHRLSTEQGGDEMVKYAHRHPHAAKRLSRFMGFEPDGSDGHYRHIGRNLPFVRLDPTRELGSSGAAKR
ncbi:MAG: nitroreductase family deazaflavin-dependent oxidoreductase [Candidatus Nanopelagicales bacterium]|nr:nitroreductase family deazaflavin-dependent oxidoreductase [Candidatus Nanopelagicales bacterium]